MKSVALSILTFLITALLIYLTGSFANATFDISLWNGTDRGFVGFMGLLFAVFVAAGTYYNLEAFK